MAKPNEEKEIFDYFEVEPKMEDEVVVIEDEPEVGAEPPAGFEDMLYEEWRDREFEAELREQDKARKVAENAGQ